MTRAYAEHLMDVFCRYLEKDTNSKKQFVEMNKRRGCTNTNLRKFLSDYLDKIDYESMEVAIKGGISDQA